MIDNRLKIKLKSFRFQIALYYLLAGLVLIGLFGGVIYQRVSDIFVKEAVSKTQMAIETSADRTGDYIRHTKSVLQIYAKDPALLAYASNADVKEQEILDKISAIKSSDSHIFEVFVMPKHGKPLASKESPTMPRPEDITPDGLCLSSERASEYPHADLWTVTISVPIVDINNEKLGMLAMDLDYCLFTHTLSDLDMGTNGNIFIVNDTNELIFHTNEPDLTVGSNYEEFSTLPPNGYDSTTNILTHSFAIPETNWTMVGTASLDGLKILRRQLFNMVMFTGILLFLTLLSITITVSKRLTKPISRLVDHMEDIESLAELTVHAGEISETAALTVSYNRMIQRIKELMQELETKQSKLRQFELDALTSQINPHFLYNTLDTIVWLAEFRDNDKIIALTKSLATFFRLSLNSGRAIVSLGDEIEHVKQYLFIQKERYGDKLTYSFDVDECVLEYMVPKIILQPIVENALYHGIRSMDGIGHISITTEINDTALELRIADNGVGFEAQNSIPKSDKKSGGVGLRNVERRLKLYDGNNVDLRIESALGEGTVVTLILKNG